jgi:hypothetical protein
LPGGPMRGASSHATDRVRLDTSEK